MPTVTLPTLIKRMQRLQAADLRKVTGDATHPMVIEFARKQLASSGAYGGAPWDGYAGEPKYAAYKAALGVSLSPLRWKPGMERLAPAMTNPSDARHRWIKGPNGWTLDIALSYLARLETGGINQFGERFAARRLFPAKSPLERDAARATSREFSKLVDALGFKTTRK